MRFFLAKNGSLALNSSGVLTKGEDFTNRPANDVAQPPEQQLRYEKTNSPEKPFASLSDDFFNHDKSCRLLLLL
ncbi:MAG: hypothetical protein CL584_09580 [Alteromonadaceae bacterium]|jgi:hypothetical protein|nr:hypothetical protein [Alteromonadaceae bacterium]|tara:strand:- start:68784 stop:69005 length:222 start_codon:yes stop_codon:yes gene_type:complete